MLHKRPHPVMDNDNTAFRINLLQTAVDLLLTLGTAGDQFDATGEFYPNKYAFAAKNKIVPGYNQINVIYQIAVAENG